MFKPIDERVLRAKIDVFVALDRQRRRLADALVRIDDERRAAERSRAETQVLFHLSELTSRCTAGGRGRAG